jgi:sugar O-acyltransferase (sialic acid O-acetyltransferase NeuD family)
MDNNIVLYGASGHGKVIVDSIRANNLDIYAVVDDNPNCTSILGYKVYHSSEFDFFQKIKMIISVGNNHTRAKIANRLTNVQFATIVHPKAIISKYAVIDEGTVVMAGSIVNVDAKIGKHCIINTGAVVEHDCEIDDYVHISPKASLAGGVKVGIGSQIGIGACVIQNVKIGKWATVGAGAVIINDIPDYAVVVGNPGKVIKIKDHE